MYQRANEGQSGGINISSSIGSMGGDIVGRDKITNLQVTAELEKALHPVSEVIDALPPATQAEAGAKPVALKEEAAKGSQANDSVVAKLVKGLVGLAPGAVSAVVSAFATPVLGAVAGPATKFVFDELQGSGP